jgi:hypothetical protein
MDKAKIAALLQRFPCVELASGNLRTCPVRLSYPHLFKAHVGKKFAGQAEPKFQATLLFPKGADISTLENAAKATAIEEWGPKWQSLKVKLPFLDQGAEGPGQAGYTPGAALIRCTSSQRPGVKLRDMADAGEADVYPGVWALVTVRPFASDYGTKRVSLGLQNVMILANDDRLGGGGARAEEDFEPIDGLDDIDGELEGADFG